MLDTGPDMTALTQPARLERHSGLPLGARLRQVRAVCGLLVLLGMAALWLAMPVSRRWRRALEVTGWRVLLGSFGVRLRVTGMPEGGAVMAANHLSWLDIPALAAASPAPFVAKAEVGRWAVIGPLARRLGCVFVDRTRLVAAGAQVAAVHAGLAPGRGMILFPEGTTGDGSGLLPFRSSLFAAVTGIGQDRVQPVAIRYLAKDGAPLMGEALRRVVWIDDDQLLPHAMALAAAEPIIAEVTCLEPIAAADRKNMAAACRSAILAFLASDQAATLKRVA